LPRLVERAGNGAPGEGSITAFYTVLTEGDDPNDPIADAARAILDGHIVLSRNLAEAGIYPAVDIEASISRLMTEVAGSEHIKTARRFKQLYSLYRQNSDLINIGAYVAGNNPELDEAIGMYGKLLAFLQQDMQQAINLPASIQALNSLFSGSPAG